MLLVIVHSNSHLSRKMDDTLCAKPIQCLLQFLYFSNFSVSKKFVVSPSLVLYEEIIHPFCLAVSVCGFIFDFPLFLMLDEQLHTVQRASKGLFLQLVKL